jgi:hypothetical protein
MAYSLPGISDRRIFVLSIADYILLGIIFAAAVCALIFIFRRKKKGCSGCGGCDGCQGCPGKKDGNL